MILDNGIVRLEITDGGTEVLEMLATYRPGSGPPPPHYHPRQEERFEVREGALRFVVDGVTRVVQAGESLVVPARAVHTARNHSADEPAVARWLTRPAMRTKALFIALNEALRSGGGLLAKAAVMREFRHEFVLASPPRLVQTCVFGLLAPIARLLGKAPTTS